MNIENSPFHITKNKISNINEVQKPKTNVKNVSNNIESIEKFSFWDWFRGVVNPLQNLPIISGIYSSMNSDDSKSDRDLIQNSLGGFIYGGPIGAIAGFGNWAFNKIFDKTPTELALDATGISDIWKNDDKSSDAKKIVNLDTEQEQIHSSVATRNYSGEWWKKNQITNLNKKDLIVTQTHKDLEFVGKDNLKIVNKKDQTDISLKYNFAEFETLKNKEIIDKNFESVTKLVNIEKKLKKIKPNLTSDRQDSEEINEKRKFREINFDYPVWKPDGIDIGRNKTDQKGKNFINQKYMELKKQSVGANFNMKL